MAMIKLVQCTQSNAPHQSVFGYKLATLHSELATYGLVVPNHPLPPTPFDLENDDAGAVDDQVLAEVKLAATHGKMKPVYCSIRC